MSVGKSVGAVIAQPGQRINISSLVSVTAGSNPPYLIALAPRPQRVHGGQHGNTGTLSGNGRDRGFHRYRWRRRQHRHRLHLECRDRAIHQFHLRQSRQPDLRGSTTANDNTSLSIFGTSSLAYANAYAANPFVLDANPVFSLTKAASRSVTEPHFAGPTPVQATPESVCSAALSFVGDA